MRSRFHRPTGEHTLTAVLVENHRIDGKPRQGIVVYLGSIGEQRTTDYFHQIHFWTSATYHLDRFDFDAATGARIRDSLARVVPLPTPEGRDQAMKEIEDTKEL